ncbi:hypothetical protein GCM10007047_32620 [Cerasicoccus arenae]|uniref:Uncharacterized protein n=2 Tax=Cerasicoccus arenae TaxID=424488 RepID=A0A8J3DIR7_9BACT|nr:hypothetical protein GCM10007047_32620 [Cerasicoccus arenae]
MIVFALKRNANDAANRRAQENQSEVELVVSQPEPVQQIPANLTLENIIVRHLTATKINEVTTLKLKASLSMGEQDAPTDVHAVTLYFRRPNYIRRILEHDGMRFDMGFDGQNIWAQQIGRNGVAREFDQLTDEHKKQFRDASNIGSYLWRYETEPEHFTRLEDTIMGGMPAHVIAYETEQERVLTYIDVMSFYEIGRKEAAKGTGEKAVYMSMSDHQNTNGVVMPHRIISSVDGEQYSSVTIENAEINAGLPSYIFNAPDVRYTVK